MKWISNYAVLIVLGLSVSGCIKTPNEDSRVTVKYEQLGSFTSYKTSEDASGTHLAGESEIFILYRINSINNSKPSAKHFTFDEDRVLTAGPGGLLNWQYDLTDLLLPFASAAKEQVPAGALNSLPGCIIQKAKIKPETPLLSLVDLIHQFDADQPVTMERLPSDTTTAGYNGTPGPALLQAECTS